MSIDFSSIRKHPEQAEKAEQEAVDFAFGFVQARHAMRARG